MKKLLIPALMCCIAGRISAQPVISSTTPSYSAPVGGNVVIHGSNFDPIATNNIVFLGAVKAIVSAASATSLTVTVPQGSTYGPISVTTNNLTAYSPLAFSPTPPGVGILDANSFETKVDFATSNYPRYIVSSDLNDDGKPDIAVVNNTGNSLSVFKNNSSGGILSLSPRADYGTGVNPMQATAGDIDGDGKPDLIVGNYNTASNTIYIFRNISTGGEINLASAVSIPTDPNPRFTVVSDINADGKPDIIVVNNNGYSVSVFANSSTVGSISFAQMVTFALGTWPMPVAVADIDGDGKPDIIAGDHNDNVISVLRNLSTGSTVSFASRLTFTTGTNPNSLTVGDLDFDGKTDIVSGNIGSDNISIFKNYSTPGNILLSPKTDISTGDGPYDVTIGDIDGDGKPDIVTANFYASTVSVLKNLSIPGTISFQPKVDFLTGTLPRCVSICDYDGDGRPDLAVANSTANTMSILKNNVSLAPLKLSGIKALIVSNGSLVSWQTTNEQNTSHFIIEYSYDGINFSDIGRVEASVTSTNSGNYQFIHTKPKIGLNYYRLKMFDIDFSYSISPTVTTTFNYDWQISLSSNPVRNQVYLYHPETQGAKIIINDITGKTISKISAAKNSGQTLIDLTRLSAGSYIVLWKDRSRHLSCKLMVY